MTLPPARVLHALVLDLDDTILVDRAGSEPAWDAAIAALLERAPALEPGALRRALRSEADWFWSDPERHRRGRLDLPAARLEVMERGLARVGLHDPGLAELATARFLETRERGVRFADGAEAALRRLRDAFPRLVLLSNGASDAQRAKLERFGLTAVFDYVQIEGEAGVGKPEPEAFRRACGGVDARTSRCLMVGDDHARDVLGALSVGMHAAWIDVLDRGEPPEAPPRAHAVVRSLAELADRLLDDARAQLTQAR